MYCLITIVIAMMLFVLPIKLFGAVIMGNPDGEVTLVAVIDYQCLHCHEVYPVIQKLITQNPQVKVKFMPVAIINRNSLYEAAASIAATRYPGKFLQLSKYIMSKPPLHKKDIDSTLRQFGLDTVDFTQAMHSHVVKAQLEEGLELLQRYHAGTPLFIIYSTRAPYSRFILRGYQSYANVQKAIMSVQPSHHWY